ncbi:MAG: O-acetyl-ADP-ribose deacetylase [Spirochaetales bacterium]|nr:O-acetyl-ADP-ribose deacetylase [Spirochaetales bacterium]
MIEFSDGITLLQGDIIRETSDAIVNAANSSLLGGMGVDGAIHRAGGPKVLAECKAVRESRYPDGLPTGEAVATSAGNLSSKWIIHTVGPIWRGGASGEEALLKSCYTSALDTASQLGAKSISFPAISTGVYGYPKERAAIAAFSAVKEWLSAHSVELSVRFVLYSASDMDTWSAVYKALYG